MPCDIFGFVETAPAAGGPWRAAFGIGDIVGCADAFSNTVFGLAKFVQAGPAPFADRGIPDDASIEVRNWISSIAQFESETGDRSGDFGHTHATLAELGNLSVPPDTPWHTVFARIGELQRAAGLSGADIRLVLWANW